MEKIIKEIDLNNWYRKEFYECFCGDENPMYVITTKIDVTNLYNFSKANNISFYFSLGHCFSKVLKQIEEFNIRVVNGKLAVLNNEFTSFTCKEKDDRLFKFVNYKYNENIIDYAKTGKQYSITQKDFYGTKIDGTYLAWFTCLPWLEFTQMQNPRSGDVNDFIPRIAWGKFIMENGKVFVNVSVEVNHRIIDGELIGTLIGAVQNYINNNKF